MRRIFAIYFVIAILLVPTWGQERAPLANVFPALESYVRAAMEAEEIPGTVVVIVKDGKIVYLKGFGVKVIGQKDPVDEHTPFALASVSKTFTNTLVARLVDQGKLHWKDKVTKYLPEFRLSDPKTTEEFTIEDLLSHRAGLPGFSADTLIEMGWDSPEIISHLKDIPVEGEFRKTYDYQNVLVGVVGKILEKVTGKSLSQLYKEELFDPISLAETRLAENTAPSLWQRIVKIFRKEKSQPTFHDSFQGHTRYLANGNPGLSTFPASSGIISTGHDMGKWMIFQLNNTVVNGKPLVSEANLTEMRTPHVDMLKETKRQFPPNRVTRVQYGLGWFIQDYAGFPILSHMGAMTGMRAMIFLIPNDNVGIAVLTNMGGGRVTFFPEGITNKFLDLYFNVPDKQDWAKQYREDTLSYRKRLDTQRRSELIQNPTPARDPDYYTGIYENSLYGRLEIRSVDGALVLSYRDLPPTKLKHWNGNAFEFAGSALSFGFPGTDLGEAVFSSDPEKAERMMVSLLHEGKDPIFYRVK